MGCGASTSKPLPELGVVPSAPATPSRCARGLRELPTANGGASKPAAVLPAAKPEAEAADEPFSSPLEYPLYAMKMADFLKLDTLRDHNSLRADGLVVALDFDGEHSGVEINFVSHQWLGLQVADPNSAHLKTMQDVFTRAKAGENIFKNDEMWLTFVKGRSKQMEKSQGNEAITKSSASVWAPEKSAETFARSVREGWVWMDFISVPQTIGCTSAAEVAVEVEAQGRAIASIPGYVLRTTNFWVCCPGGCQHVDHGHACGHDSWERRGWCRMEAVCADIAKVFDSRALYVMQPLGATPSVETVDFMDRMQGHLQKRSSVLNGDFSCCRMDHQVKAMSGELIPIPCDKARLKAVLMNLLARQLARLRRSWESRLDLLPADMAGRNFESMMGADKGSYFKYIVLQVLEQNILAENAPEMCEEAATEWWAAKGWADGIAPEAKVAEFDAEFSYCLPRAGGEGGAEAYKTHIDGWVWQMGMFGNVPLTRYLVETCGGDVTHVNRHGMTALKLAATFGQLPLVRYICEREGGAAHLDHISGGLGLTALGCAAKCGHPGTIKELLRHGAAKEPRRKDNEQTPLLEAAARGQLEACKALLEAGADAAAKDKDGHTAADLARARCQPNAAQVALLDEAVATATG